jgi:hypothetical protein
MRIFEKKSQSLCNVDKGLSEEGLIFPSESFAFSLLFLLVMLHGHVVAWVLGSMWLGLSSVDESALFGVFAERVCGI